MSKYLLKNGLVWLEGEFRQCDLYLEDKKISLIDNDLKLKYVTEIDCKDSYIIPGIIDMHVHTGEPLASLLPLEDEKMTAISGLKGGVTSIGSFITETPYNNILSDYPRRNKKFRKQPLTVRWHLTPISTKISELKDLFLKGCDLKLYTTYKDAGLYSSYQDIERVIKYLANHNKKGKGEQVPILIHCEDNEIIERESAKNPFHKPFDHTLRRPELAEIKGIERVLDLAVKYNYHVHIVHVSSPRAALLIKEAKKSAPVTCETAPHYLLLNEQYLKRTDGHRWLCTPPLRSETSRGQMIELAQEGVFDAFATDHCPFSVYDKDRFSTQPELVPMGLPGIGSLFPLLYEGLVKTEKFSFSQLLRHLTINPAKILRLYPGKGIIQVGSDADLIVLKDNNNIREPIQPTVALSHNPWKDKFTSLELQRIFVKGQSNRED